MLQRERTLTKTVPGQEPALRSSVVVSVREKKSGSEAAAVSMSENHPGKRPPAAPPAESPDQRARRRVLGDRLRDYYDAVAREPVPDEFEALLNNLAKTAGSKSGGEGSSQ
jgi:hypothetical protein